MFFVITTRAGAEEVGQIVSTLNLGKPWYVVVSIYEPDAAAQRERHRKMRAELEQLRARVVELEQAYKT